MKKKLGVVSAELDDNGFLFKPCGERPKWTVSVCYTLARKGLLIYMLKKKQHDTPTNEGGDENSPVISIAPRKKRHLTATAESNKNIKRELPYNVFEDKFYKHLDKKNNLVDRMRQLLVWCIECNLQKRLEREGSEDKISKHRIYGGN